MPQTKSIREINSLTILKKQSYHYPGVTNNLYISPATFEALAAHPNIVGTKLSHGIIDDQTLIAASPRIVSPVILVPFHALPRDARRCHADAVHGAPYNSPCSQ